MSDFNKSDAEALADVLEISMLGNFVEADKIKDDLIRRDKSVYSQVSWFVDAVCVKLNGIFEKEPKFSYGGASISVDLNESATWCDFVVMQAPNGGHRIWSSSVKCYQNVVHVDGESIPRESASAHAICEAMSGNLLKLWKPGSLVRNIATVGKKQEQVPT